MKTVITYGTFDLLHYGHINLLKRAKALGDYLIVGVTSDNFDKQRGKINVSQNVLDRVDAVRKTGLADKVIIEEYEGQKIDDIIKYHVDIFTVGSDWKGVFDYLNDYCKVVYLDRTEGISSSEIRSNEKEIKIGVVGDSTLAQKFINESRYVNGAKISGVFTCDKINDKFVNSNIINCKSYNDLLKISDAVYIISHPARHYEETKQALECGKHVLCESPISLTIEEKDSLFALAKKNNLILMDSLKTAFSVAYSRMINIIKGGIIGKVVSVDASCTSLKKIDYSNESLLKQTWSSIFSWGPTALLPVFQLLGSNYTSKTIITHLANQKLNFDDFTKIGFIYPDSTATIKVGIGVKTEGELVVSGTKGYIYVPAPWWKTEYFESRFEDQNLNKRYYFKIDGEGIRYEIVAFIGAIMHNPGPLFIPSDVTNSIVSIIQSFEHKSYLKI
jgi:choline-phosphate cytidylyltransferase